VWKKGVAAKANEKDAMSSAPELLIDGPRAAAKTIVLAHGAGAGMDSPFMASFAAGLAKEGVRVVRFEFPYMAAKRATGRRKPPDRESILRQTWLEVVNELGHEGLIIGGKSMGGRIASLIADEARISALVCLGYPFHPVGKPDQLRIEHLRAIKTRTLILQGDRDLFGSRAEVATYPLSRKVRVQWLKDGNHSFEPRKASGVTEEQNWQKAISDVVAFIESSSSKAD
jgi:predicted alpha/beta-hydrolase family hydrolase